MKVDIIIPCYKAHPYLPRMLGSILSQSIIKDLKITLVNDADSQDYSQIVKNFKPYMNIQEIKLETNLGPGGARMKGYENTSNPLVTFADADDTFAFPLALQRLREYLEEFVISIGDIMEEIVSPENKTFFKPHVLDGVRVYGKMYRRDFLDKYNIRMNNTRACEDTSFNTLCRILANNKMINIGDTVYIWQSINEKSIVRNNKYEFWYDISFKNYVNNMIWVFNQLKTKLEIYELKNLEDIVINEKIDVLMTIYRLYEEALHNAPEYKISNLQYAKKYYNKIYKEIENNISTETFVKNWNSQMNYIYKENRFIDFIPENSIRQFIEILKNN